MPSGLKYPFDSLCMSFQSSRKRSVFKLPVFAFGGKGYAGGGGGGGGLRPSLGFTSFTGCEALFELPFLARCLGTQLAVTKEPVVMAVRSKKVDFPSFLE